MSSVSRYWIEPLAADVDLDGVLEVEAESFTNPWTREMYSGELQNRSMCHVFVVRTEDCRVAGFCAFWLVLDEIHINNFALRPRFRAQGLGTALLQRVLAAPVSSARAGRRSRCGRPTAPPDVCMNGWAFMWPVFAGTTTPSP
jgi:ribosomal protein S18 acetylase RimI-like enzyme